MPQRKETELYQPIKQFLQVQGYEVRGEVASCDLVAVRADQVVVVELKAAFNLTLVLQGVARQKLTEDVYVAVEAPGSRRNPSRWREIQDLCRRLGLGLLTVRFGRKGATVDVWCDPAPYVPRKRSRGPRAALLGEFQKRSGDFNTGGGTRRPIVTAYREEALVVAAYLQTRGPSLVREIRLHAALPNAGAILQKDYYGWFERIAIGQYQLSAKGVDALRLYAEVVAAAANPK